MNKKKFLVLFIFILIIVIDFIFFDYDVSDLKGLKVDSSDIYKKVSNSIEADLPFLFEESGFYIKDCNEYFRYKPKAVNAFEKSILRDLNKKCTLLKFLRNAKVSSNSFIDYMDLKEFNSWDKELYFKYTCEKTIDYTNIISKYNSVKEMINDNILDIKIVEPKKIIVHNNLLNKTFQIRDLFRANFDDTSKTKDILLEISVADDSNDYIECVNYVIFSREDTNSILKEQKIPFKQKNTLRN